MIPFNHIPFIAFLLAQSQNVSETWLESQKRKIFHCFTHSFVSCSPSHLIDCLICLQSETYFFVRSSKSNNSLFYCFSIVWNNLSISTLAHKKIAHARKFNEMTQRKSFSISLNFSWDARFCVMWFDLWKYYLRGRVEVWGKVKC